MFTRQCLAKLFGSGFITPEHWNRCADVTTLLAQRIICLSDFGDGYLTTKDGSSMVTFPNAEVVMFGFNDKNFNYYMASRRLYPKLTVYG